MLQFTGRPPAAWVAAPAAPVAWPATPLAVSTRDWALTRWVTASRSDSPGRLELETAVLQPLALPAPVAIQQLAARCSVLASRATGCESLLARVNWCTAIPADAMPVVPSMAAAMASPILFIV